MRGAQCIGLCREQADRYGTGTGRTAAANHDAGVSPAASPVNPAQPVRKLFACWHTNARLCARVECPHCCAVPGLPENPMTSQQLSDASCVQGTL